jgi:hypothetical protein
MNTFEIRWDEATFMEGAKLAYDYDMRHTWRRYAGWLFIALVQFGVVGAVLHGAPGLLLISSLLVVYWYFLRWPLRRRALRRFYEKSPFVGKTLRVEPTEKGICIDEACVPWDGFVRGVASPKGYLLEMCDSFLYLPRHIFPDARSRNGFMALVRENVPRFETFGG